MSARNKLSLTNSFLFWYLKLVFCASQNDGDFFVKPLQLINKRATIEIKSRMVGSNSITAYAFVSVTN